MQTPNKLFCNKCKTLIPLGKPYISLDRYLEKRCHEVSSNEEEVEILSDDNLITLCAPCGNSFHSHAIIDLIKIDYSEEEVEEEELDFYTCAKCAEELIAEVPYISITEHIQYDVEGQEIQVIRAEAVCALCASCGEVYSAEILSTFVKNLAQNPHDN